MPTMWEPSRHLPALSLISAPPSSAPPPPHLQHSRLRVFSVLCMQSLCAEAPCLPHHTRPRLCLLGPLLPLLCSVSQDARAPRPFATPPWRRACSFHRLCAQNAPLPDLGLAPVSCHPNVPRPPTLRCLFYFLHRISCWMKLFYSFVFISFPSPPLDSGLQGDRGLSVHDSPSELKLRPSPGEVSDIHLLKNCPLSHSTWKESCPWELRGC